MKFSEFQVVKTLIDFPDENIESGEAGTVVACFSYPFEAYEVEFVNKNGSTRAQFAIRPEHLEHAEIQVNKHNLAENLSVFVS